MSRYNICPNCSSGNMALDVTILVSMEIDKNGRPQKLRGKFEDIERIALRETMGNYFCYNCGWQEFYEDEEIA